MKNLHIKFEYENALEARRELLSTQMEILEFLKRFRDYKDLRRRELILKSRLKNELASLNSETIRLQDALPKDEDEEEMKEIQKITRKKHKEMIREAKSREHKDIERELEDIKEKLEQLS